MSTGGLGILSTEEFPPETILIEDLPADVRALFEDETAKGEVKEITRGVRMSDGKYFYTITYADPFEALTVIQCWHDGTLISRERIQ